MMPEQEGEPMSEAERFVRQTAATVAADWHLVAGIVGLTAAEFEALAGVFRREVEDGIRAARVRLLCRLEGKGANDGG